MADFKRNVALKVRIKDLIDGKYFREEDMNPNYIKDKYGKKIFRVNLLATVVGIDESENYKNFILDDGSGKISARFFDDKMIDAGVGDVVLLIGRPREYGNEKYLFPEVIKKIEDKRWIKVRELELRDSFVDDVGEKEVYKEEEVIEEGVEIIEPVEEKEKSDSERILDKIREFDKGDGVDIEDVVKGINDGDALIELLLKEGEIFEIRPGRLKVLE
jgi:RPA family protein